MPIIETKSGYGYIYRKSEKKEFRLPVIFKILFWLVLIFAIVIGAIFVSGKIKSFVGINDKVIFENKEIYLISVGEFQDYNTAYILSENIKKQGGAGYIYKNNNIFNVLTSAYENKNDALSVIENLSNENIDAEIIALKLQAINSSDEIKKDELVCFKNSVNAFYETYLKLYELSVGYDQKALTKLSSFDEIDRIKGSLQSTLSEFSENYVNSGNAVYVYLKVYLSNLIENLEDLKTKESNFGGEIKNCYIECLMTYKEFRQEIH
ncbi:MAG: hypothetical protein KBT30_02760 [Clostridiales bacterium]|nr:hypothetical protein [Candidatus Apopatousia equi]